MICSYFTNVVELWSYLLLSRTCQYSNIKHNILDFLIVLHLVKEDDIWNFSQLSDVLNYSHSPSGRMCQKRHVFEYVPHVKSKSWRARWSVSICHRLFVDLESLFTLNILLLADSFLISLFVVHDYFLPWFVRVKAKTVGWTRVFVDFVTLAFD